MRYNIVDNFKNELLTWMHENDIIEVKDVMIGSYFCAHIEEHTVILGGLNQNSLERVGKWADHFFVKNGCKYSDIPAVVIAILHEVGHIQTYTQFSFDERMDFYEKKKPSHTEEEAYEYWYVPDEYAANKWAIEYINTHIKAVLGLYDICTKYWSRITREADRHSLALSFGGFL